MSRIVNIELSMELIPFKMKYIPYVISWIKSEKDMVQWAGSAFTWPMSQRQFRNHQEKAKQECPCLFPFALVKDDKIIGYCEISDYRRQFHSAMLSLVIISPRYRGKGYGSLLVKKAIDHAFCILKLNRLALGVFDFNKTAIRCYGKMGFILEGTMRESAKAGESYWNCHLMSILRKEWKY